jgi:tRNA pseudouridine55 synthase
VTSFDVVSAVRRAIGVRQVGHTGTLDPLASGLLPVLVGEATKLTPFMMALDKQYEATARLGVATDTYDVEGRVVATAEDGAVERVTEDAVRAALAPLVGRIRQRPPAYSAIKKNGRRLYELARAGEDAEAAPREVSVHALSMPRFALPDVELHVRCGKGTYVRSLVHDLGESLGVHAHMTALRRTRIGDFLVDDAVPLAALDAEAAPRLLPLEHAVAHLPTITVDAEVERRLRMGQQAALETLEVPLQHAAGPLRLCDGNGHLVAIAEAAPHGVGRLQLARVFRSMDPR